MKTQKIKEGDVVVTVPAGRIYDASVFYNKDAELTRDVSVAAVQVFRNTSKNKLTVLDALSATGIRGMRYVKEVKGINKIVLNDNNPVSVKLIKKNVALNKLGKKCTVVKSDANLLMRQNVYGIIDIDPFGPPVQFLDSCARSIFHKGFAAITATDTSALCGTYPLSCFRKYGIKSIESEFYNELGIRILITSIILSMAKHNRAFVPVLSFPYKHYFRTFGKIEHGGQIETLLNSFGHVSYCKKCGDRHFGEIKLECDKKHKMEICGPIYLGKINDADFIGDVVQEIHNRTFRLKLEELKILNNLKEESNFLFYYDIHNLSKIYKFPIPKFDLIIEKLHKKGFIAVKTVFSDKSIRTDAKLKDILDILR